jgi:hypothetical protein
MGVGLAMTTGVGVQAQSLDAEPVDKSGYHLFHPTPSESMRELSTDRPDQTESAYSVDAGHFQVEMDVVSATFDHDTSGGGSLRTQTWTAGGINLKAGLLNNVDIQFVFEAWTKARVEDEVANTVTESEGTGDLQTRLKINLWGNDGGRTALAIMPFVKWPLSESDVRNGKTEGGLIIPFAADLGGGWGLGAMTEFDFISDGNGGRDTEYFNTITAGRDLCGNLGGYVEFAALVAPESGTDWQGQLGLGFTYGLCEDARLDFGCNFGVTESAPDYNPFLGLSFRF